MKLSPVAGKPAEPSMLVNVPRLITAYYTEAPNPSVPEQRVAFGTSGHRGSPFEKAFHEWHILAISQAICLSREQGKIDGPLFPGMDTHALSELALASALEVLAANGVEVMLAEGDEYTPTPPPHDGGFKYNSPNAGPAESGVTGWIGAKANEYIENGLRGVKRIPFERALQASTTHRHDYLNTYIADLANVLDMDAIGDAKISLGVDPLGGAGVHYWGPIAGRYRLNLTVVNDAIDPTTFQHRPKWREEAAVGKTVVSSRRIDRVTAKLGRKLYEVPVGFKWFVDGLLDGSLGFADEEIAGASFIRLDGSVWTTDKDGMVPALLAAEITARMDRDPGEKIQAILTRAPANGAPIGGLKVVTDSGWFAARPSGTEDIYKIYAETFRGTNHLRRILEQAETMVSEALAVPDPREKS